MAVIDAGVLSRTDARLTLVGRRECDDHRRSPQLPGNEYRPSAGFTPHWKPMMAVAYRQYNIDLVMEDCLPPDLTLPVSPSCVELPVSPLIPVDGDGGHRQCSTAVDFVIRPHR